MSQLNTSADARLCPRCQRDNRCAIALGQDISECWCHAAEFNPQRVAAYRGLERCLCENCGTELAAANTVQQHTLDQPSSPSTRKDSHGQ